MSTSLSLRHLKVLDALRADAARPDGAEGLTTSEITSIGQTSWPETLIRVLLRHGYVISLDHGRYFLGAPVEVGSRSLALLWGPVLRGCLTFPQNPRINTTSPRSGDRTTRHD